MSPTISRSNEMTTPTPTVATTSTTTRSAGARVGAGVGVGANNTNKKSRKSSTRNGNGADDDDEDEKDFSVEKNEGDADTIVVMAHVKDKIIPVHCGFGTQQVAWLGHVAIARYDDELNQGWRELGVPTKMIKDAKDELPLSAIIYDVLQNHSHVYISTSL